MIFNQLNKYLSHYFTNKIVKLLGLNLPTTPDYKSQPNALAFILLMKDISGRTGGSPPDRGQRLS